MDSRSAIVVGAGILGLATARALALKGYSVKVFDRSGRAIGASVRNFGMILPLGQPAGKILERAIHSRNIWKQICDEQKIWYNHAGSLFPVYNNDEWIVLQELQDIFQKENRNVQLLRANDVAKISDAVVPGNLKGALFSSDELIIDPREAISKLPDYLSTKFNITFHWEKCVTQVQPSEVKIGNTETHKADLVFICSGSDFETLYPDAFSKFPLTKCKLQMMRLAAQPGGWRIGPMLVGALSLIHYKSFQNAPSLPLLKRRFEAEMPDYIKWGIHVMVSQNESGQLSIGDSHEYGTTHDPFDKQFINQLILDYLKTFARFRDWNIVESWNGIYSKLTDGETDLVFSPEPGVYVVNGVSGAGMTLSFGFAEELISSL